MSIDLRPDPLVTRSRAIALALAIAVCTAFYGCASNVARTPTRFIPADAERRTDIRLNGTVVGQSERGSFFWVDQVPGDCTVATSTEVEKQLSFKLAAGETRYVKTTVSLGIMVGRINPALTSTEEWNRELPNLHYTGKPLKQ